MLHSTTMIEKKKLNKKNSFKKKIFTKVMLLRLHKEIVLPCTTSNMTKTTFPIWNTTFIFKVLSSPKTYPILYIYFLILSIFVKTV